MPPTTTSSDGAERWAVQPHDRHLQDDDDHAVDGGGGADGALRHVEHGQGVGGQPALELGVEAEREGDGHDRGPAQRRGGEDQPDRRAAAGLARPRPAEGRASQVGAPRPASRSSRPDRTKPTAAVVKAGHIPSTEREVDHVARGERPEGHAERLPGELPREHAAAVLGGDPAQHQHRLGRCGGGDPDAEDEHAGEEGRRRAGEDEVAGAGCGDQLGRHGDPHRGEPVGQPPAERGGDQGTDREQARRRGGDEAAPAAGVRGVGVLVRQHRPPPDHRHRRRQDQQPCALHRFLHTC